MMMESSRSGFHWQSPLLWRGANFQERELKRQKREDRDAASVHVGEIGKRLRSVEVTVEMIRDLGDNPYGYGNTELVKFRTSEGLGVDVDFRFCARVGP